MSIRFFRHELSMSNQPILFYSTRCAHSKQIMETLEGLQKTKLFQLFSIDGRSRDQLPPFLKSVPTVYVPETKDIYTGQAIYGYIAKPVAARREIPTNAPPTAVQQQQGTPNVATAGDYQAWSFSGSGALTEGYSSWDAPNKFAVDDQLQYSYLSGTVATPAPKEPETKQSYDGDKAGKNNDVSSRLEKLQQQRDAEFKGISRQ
jgi:hypothetical protein